MKNKKTKWIRLLSIGGAVMAIGTVPIAMTACAKKSTNQTVTKATPKIKSDITLVGKFSDLVSVDTDTTTDELISQNLQKDLSKVIENYKDIKDGKVVFKSNLSEDDKKFNNGTKDYDDWKLSASSNIVYYSSTSPQLTIKSTKDLNTQISTNLSEIIKNAGFANPENKEFKLNNENKIGVDKDMSHVDMLHVSVTATDKSNKKTGSTEIDLVIPTSDINFVPDKATVEVSGSNVTTKSQEVKFKYDVGIDSNVNKITNNNIGIEEGKTPEDADAVLKALGWNSSEEIISDYDIVKSNKIFNEELILKTTSSNINSQKMGKSIGIFNTKFSEFNVIKNESNDFYKISVKGTPNLGYFWDDGSNLTKEFVLSDELKITVKNASLADSSNSDVDKNDGGQIVELNYDGRPGQSELNTSDNNKENENIKNFYKIEENSKRLIEEANKNVSLKELIRNAEISSINIEKTKVISNGGGNTNRIRVALNVVPNKDSSWKDNGGLENRIIYVKMGFATQ
ncbi:P35 family lipoprotein [Malacoplasma iowae]|uniref:P35 family lipoprotein n=1 Tax=Malacoplasma iowae TaxID=2116 RepID=UPI002A1870BC|nr:P35 family lipoprotein [Malacoplasma iowae]WPL37486.1 P35 family lipoprotein [Malacoplasma iowae]